MGPKRALRKLEEVVMDAEDPLVIETQKTLSRWVERVNTTNKKIQHVQHLLATLSAEMEARNTELNDVYDTANLLSSLRIAEYRQKVSPQTQTVPVKKQRSKRDAAPRTTPPQNTDDKSTEALLAAMDERKRQKISSFLVNFFKRSSLENFLMPVGRSISLPASRGATVSPVETIGRQQQCPGGSSILFSETASTEQRRPKDVPAEIWEELSALRASRVSLETRITELMGGIESQSARFDLLAQNHRVATHTVEKMEQELQILRQKKGAASKGTV